MAAQQPLFVVDDPKQAEVMLKPHRLRLLALLREPHSASAAAEKLGMPRQLANYHVRELEEAGLLLLVEERKKGNCTERVLQATAAAFAIGPATLGPLASDPSKMQDRFSLEYLIALGERLVGELSAMLPMAREGREPIPTLSIETIIGFESVEERATFARELTNEIARLISKYHREGAPVSEAYRLLLAVHPVPER